MSAKRLALLAVFCLAVPCARGDVLPAPAGRGGGLHGNPVAENMKVSMESADVKVNLKRTQDGKIVAEAECRFEMNCIPGQWVAGGPIVGPQPFTLYFPICYADEPVPETTRFAVAVDGKPIENLEVTKWDSTDENAKLRTHQGYRWNTEFEGGKKREIVVRYALVLAQQDGKAQFQYFLRSGAEWDGPIGKESVDVVAQEGLGIEVLAPTTIKPARNTGSEVLWEIQNTKPTSDIRIVIEPAAKPKP